MDTLVNSSYPRKPTTEHEDTIYSNFDHVLDYDVADALLHDHSMFAQHAAQGFCGYVYYCEGKWYEEVWIYHNLEIILRSIVVLVLIEAVNERYGTD